MTNEYSPADLAADFRELRLAAGNPTLDIISGETSLSRTVLSDTFNGKQPPSDNTLYKLVQYFDADFATWQAKREQALAKDEPRVAASSPKANKEAKGAAKAAPTVEADAGAAVGAEANAEVGTGADTEAATGAYSRTADGAARDAEESGSAVQDSVGPEHSPQMQPEPPATALAGRPEPSSADSHTADSGVAESGVAGPVSTERLTAQPVPAPVPARSGGLWSKPVTAGMMAVSMVVTAVIAVAASLIGSALVANNGVGVAANAQSVTNGQPAADGQDPATATGAKGQAGPGRPLQARGNGVDPMVTTCKDDKAIALSEKRMGDRFLIEMLYSANCMAVWGRVTRYDNKSGGNFVQMKIYPQDQPNSKRAQVRRWDNAQGVYTPMIIQPDVAKTVCGIATVGIKGKKVELGPPICT